MAGYKRTEKAHTRWRHTWDLTSSRSSHLRLVILQQLNEVPNELLAHELLADNLSEL